MKITIEVPSGLFQHVELTPEQAIALLFILNLPVAEQKKLVKKGAYDPTSQGVGECQLVSAVLQDNVDLYPLWDVLDKIVAQSVEYRAILDWSQDG